jgi:hypothetical protein
MSRGIRIFNLALLIGLSIFSIIGCGGGSGGDTPVKTRGEYLFYVDSNDQLIAIDPNDVSQPTTVDSNLQAFDSSVSSYKTVSFRSAEISGSGSTLHVNNYRRDKILYLKNGMFYQVSTSLSGSLTPNQVSNANNLYLCDIKLTTINSAAILYSDAVNNDCNNVEYFLLRSSMDETQSPLALPGKPVNIIVDQAMNTTGFLSYVNNQLVHYDNNLNEIANLGTFPAIHSAYISLFEQTILLTEAGDFHVYDAATHTLSTSLHTLSGAIPTNFKSFNVSDNYTALYFFDGNSLYELGYNGASNARLVATEPATGSIYVSDAYQGELIYELYSSPTYDIKAINITNGTIRTLYSSSLPFYQDYMNADRIYTSFSNDVTVTFPLSDPTSITTTTNSDLAGLQFPSSYDLVRDGYMNRPWNKVLQLNNIDRPTNNSLFGAQLSVFDYPTSNLITTLGTIDSQITSLFGANYTNRFLMLGEYGLSGTDIYYVDTSVPNSLTQITFTPDTTETIVY